MKTAYVIEFSIGLIVFGNENESNTISQLKLFSILDNQNKNKYVNRQRVYM